MTGIFWPLSFLVGQTMTARGVEAEGLPPATHPTHPNPPLQLQMLRGYRLEGAEVRGGMRSRVRQSASRYFSFSVRLNSGLHRCSVLRVDSVMVQRGDINRRGGLVDGQVEWRWGALDLLTTFFSFTRRFWNQMVTWRSERFVVAEMRRRFSLVMNLLAAYSFSSSFSCTLV